MILGIHCSIRAGYEAALAEARALGCDSMQMFSYRRNHEPTEEELVFFRRQWRSAVSRLVLHVRYLPFLASRDEIRHAHSVAWARREMELAGRLGAEALVLHAGAYAPGDHVSAGLRRFAEGFARAAEGLPDPPVPLLIENVPGGGRRMGGSLEEIAELGELLRRRSFKVGFCLDTAHAWAQGYDLSSAEGMWKFIGQAHRLLGAENIRVFHLNDSRALLGSHREHHWHWGEGYLGLEGLRWLLDREEFASAVGILETPKGEQDGANLELVRSLKGARS